MPVKSIVVAGPLVDVVPDVDVRDVPSVDVLVDARALVFFFDCSPFVVVAFAFATFVSAFALPVLDFASEVFVLVLFVLLPFARLLPDVVVLGDLPWETLPTLLFVLGPFGTDTLVVVVFGAPPFGG